MSDLYTNRGSYESDVRMGSVGEASLDPYMYGFYNGGFNGTFNGSFNGTFTSTMIFVANASYTFVVGGADWVTMDPGGSNRNVQLPPIAGNTGKILRISRESSAGNVVILPNGTDTIEGLASITLVGSKDYITLGANGYHWDILAANIAPFRGHYRYYGLALSSAGYTVLDDDGIGFISCTTGGSNRTIILPTAADNNGRLLWINKADTGTGSVVVNGEGSEQVGANASLSFTLYQIGDHVALICDGTKWWVLATSGPEITYTSSSDVVVGPASGTWANVTSHSIALPIGRWEIEAYGYYKAIQSASGTAATWARWGICLSTANNSASDAQLVRYWHANATYAAALTGFYRIPPSATYSHYGYESFHIGPKTVNLTAATTYYLNVVNNYTSGTPAPTIGAGGAWATTLIRARRIA